jgi:acyl-CoA synthetase (AMP-forming)/AMP-acid ligase II
MTGYWNREQDTRDANSDGWFRTGDLGSIDEEGYVYISDRRTDLIVSGGMNVWPSEVEYCISQMACVLDVAVVGLPHERWGQTVVALVVTSDASVSEMMVINHCRASLASFKKPTRVYFTDELPKTTSLKVSRAAVRQMIQSDQRYAEGN